MVDTVVDALPIRAQQLADLNGKFNLPIRRAVGGVAVNMAVCATEVGFQSFAIIRVGAQRKSGGVIPDEAGHQILSYLKAHHVTPIVTLDAESATGEVVLVYISQSYRMGITSEGANARLRVQDCSYEKLKVAGTPDVLFIDGHVVDYPEGRPLIDHLISFSKSVRAVSVLDLLPHSLYKRMSLAGIEEFIKGVDVVQAQVNTLRRFRGTPISGPLTIKEFNDHLAFVTRTHSALILEDLGTVYAGSRSASGQRIADNCGFSDVGIQRGFGARVAARWLFGEFSAISASK
jgi:sugar/nucleoside kinase (ribokinase family)